MVMARTTSTRMKTERTVMTSVKKPRAGNASPATMPKASKVQATKKAASTKAVYAGRDMTPSRVPRIQKQILSHHDDKAGNKAHSVAAKLAEASPDVNTKKANGVQNTRTLVTNTYMPPAPDLPDIGFMPGNLDNREVYDEGEQAQWLQIQEQADIQHRARAAAAAMVQSHPAFDGKHCIDCDVAIPKRRLEMKRIRCVDCETLREEDEARQRRLTGRF